MVAVCIARNGACLNGLAKVVKDGDLRLKRSNKTPLNIHQLRIGVNVNMTSLSSLVLYRP